MHLRCQCKQWKFQLFYEIKMDKMSALSEQLHYRQENNTASLKCHVL